jgi:V-type H+-transporting ATPase subunit B
MAPEFADPRMTSIKPRIRYNTIGGVNGPLVILDNVCLRPGPPQIRILDR